jgi:hypothetical protein
MVKALLNEMSVEYPKTHDPAPVFAKAIGARGIDVDAGVLDSLTVLSQELPQIRGPAFYQDNRRHRRPGARLGSPRRARSPVRRGAARSVAPEPIARPTATAVGGRLGGHPLLMRVASAFQHATDWEKINRIGRSQYSRSARFDWWAVKDSNLGR